MKHAVPSLKKCFVICVDTAGGGKLARKCSASFLVGKDSMFFGLQASDLLLISVKMPMGNFMHGDLLLM